jgi:hypothetical protein
MDRLPIITADGVVFIAGAMDNVLRACDIDRHAELVESTAGRKRRP